MITVENYTDGFFQYFNRHMQPSEITNKLPEIIIDLIKNFEAGAITTNHYDELELVEQIIL